MVYFQITVRRGLEAETKLDPDSGKPFNLDHCIIFDSAHN